MGMVLLKRKVARIQDEAGTVRHCTNAPNREVPAVICQTYPGITTFALIAAIDISPVSSLPADRRMG